MFTETSLALKDILLGHTPKCKVQDWCVRMRNTRESLWLMFSVWTTERLTRKDGSTRKRTPKEVLVLRMVSAFMQWILEQCQVDPTVAATEVDHLKSRFLVGSPHQ